jgi:hypothetical protein
MLVHSILKDIERSALMFEPYRAIQDFRTGLTRDLEDFRRETKLVAQLYRENLGKYLAERGWFVGGTLTAQSIVNLTKAVKQGGQDAAIESALCDHVRSTLMGIERAVIQHWTDRSEILRDAFEAHRAGRFTLSIPAMLAQADGMAFEILKAHLFTNSKGKIAERAEEFMGTDLADRELMSSFVGILLEELGVRTHTDNRDTKKSAGMPFSPLNRHGVMHGIDLDYPSESTGLRAVSLLGLLTEIGEVKVEAVPTEDRTT